MMEAKLLHASILKKLFDAIKDMVTDVNLDCDQNGIRIQAMDSSHVALVSVKLEESGFIHFRCDRDRTLGLHMPSICKVFKLCGNNDVIALQNNDESDTLSFLFENTEEERMSCFDLKLMAIEQDALGIPEDDDKDVRIKMSSKEYVNTMKNLTEFSDSVRIEVDKNGMRMVTKGDIGSGEIFLRPKQGNGDDDIGVEIKVKEPVTQSYAVKYLNMFGKCGVLTDSVTLTLSNNRPIEVQFDINDIGEDKEKKQIGRVRFYLAPKMEDDNDDTGGDEAMMD